MSTARPSIGAILRPPKTAELIAHRLRTRIVRGELSTGDNLPSETDLIVQFGVSRPTLREAFRILEAESLIQVRRGSRGGAQVTAPDLAVASRYVGLVLQLNHTTLADVYEARTVLEPPCARLLAARRDSAALLELRSAVDELTDVVENEPHDRPRWAALSMRFHRSVVQLSGNQTLALQGVVLNDIAARHLSTYVARRADSDAPARKRLRKMVRSFARLAELVEAGDAAGAEQHWRQHMQAVSQVLLDNESSTTLLELFS